MKKDLKKIIKDATKEIFLDAGYQAVSMRKIARKIGYSATAIYLYYQNKEELLKDILADYNCDYEATETAILATQKSSNEKLQDLLLAYVEQALAHPEMFKLLNTHFENIRTSKAEMSANRHFAVLQELVQECLDQQIFAGDDARKIAQVLWMHVYGVAGMMVNKPQLNWGDQQQLADFAIAKILASFSAD
ncbi:MAG: TetR/AcrR family transcriptional regulator [Candidatus Cloacimonadales bacterium]